MGPVRPDLNRPATTPQTGITPATTNQRQRAADLDQPALARTVINFG
jgi:hypothetical protein